MVRPHGFHAFGVQMNKLDQVASDTILLPQRLAEGDRVDSPWERLAMSCPPAVENREGTSVSTRAAEEYMKALNEVTSQVAPSKKVELTLGSDSFSLRKLSLFMFAPFGAKVFCRFLCVTS